MAESGRRAEERDRAKQAESVVLAALEVGRSFGQMVVAFHQALLEGGLPTVLREKLTLEYLHVALVNVLKSGKAVEQIKQVDPLKELLGQLPKWDGDLDGLGSDLADFGLGGEDEGGPDKV